MALPHSLQAAGPAPVDLRSTANFAILSGAAITSTGGGVIVGDVGASPIAGSAIGVTCAQVVGTIYAVDASGPFCAVIDPTRLTTAKGDLTIAFNDAAGRTPVPTGPFLNPNGGNLGGLNIGPGLYKFTGTALITGADVTLTGGPTDVWIFQIASDLQVGSGIKVLLAGGALAKNIFWQVGTSAVLGTSSVFNGTILADQSITINTSATMNGRALAFSAGVTFNGAGLALPPAPPVLAPEIAVEQPAGTDLTDGVSSKAFGTVAVGASASLTFTIKNTGTADLTVPGILIDGLDASMFTVTAAPAPLVIPGGSTTFTVTFAPTTAGAKAAALHIANNDSDENPFDISLSGTGAVAPEIVVEQPAGTDLTDGVSNTDFGSVPSGSSATRTFTIRNTGSADLTGLGILIDGADASMFTVTVSPVAPVVPGGSTTFTVTFAPTSAGAKLAALHIASNDSDENPFDISLSASATVAPEIVVEQPAGTDLTDGVSTRDFGSVPVTSSSSLTFTIRNIGNADLTGLGIIIDGADASMFTVTASPTAPVVPGASTTFTVRFAPTTAGAKLAALHIASNDSDENPFDISLTGFGTVAPEIVVEQPAGTDLTDGVSSRDFGSVDVTNSSSLTFTIRNTGTGPLTGLGILIDGANASMFTVTASPTAPVVPGGSTTFTVRFAPVGTGLKTAALHIANNDSDESPFDITLSGTGTGGVLVTLVSPIKLNPQTGLFEQTVHLTNTNPNTVTAVRLLIEGLPEDVRVYNASGTNSGIPYVQYNSTVPIGGTIDFLIEYYRASRAPIPQPTFEVQATTPVTPTADGTIIAIDRHVQLVGGRFLIEFTSIPGRSYAVQYSSDLDTWKTATPTISAPGNRVQWYDDGPPKTESLPTSGSRFYRVVLLPVIAP